MSANISSRKFYILEYASTIGRTSEKRIPLDLFIKTYFPPQTNFPSGRENVRICSFSHDETRRICNVSIKYKQNNPSKTNEDIQGVYIEFQFKGSGGSSPTGGIGLCLGFERVWNCRGRCGFWTPARITYTCAPSLYLLDSYRIISQLFVVVRIIFFNIIRPFFLLMFRYKTNVFPRGFPLINYYSY